MGRRKGWRGPIHNVNLVIVEHALALHKETQYDRFAAQYLHVPTDRAGAATNNTVATLSVQLKVKWKTLLVGDEINWLVWATVISRMPLLEWEAAIADITTCPNIDHFNSVGTEAASVLEHAHRSSALGWDVLAAAKELVIDLRTTYDTFNTHMIVLNCRISYLERFITECECTFDAFDQPHQPMELLVSHAIAAQVVQQEDVDHN